MSSIPLALPGAVLGLIITRNPFGFTAFMGMISLCGIVVRNAIILVDYINEKMREGHSLEQAATEAGERRLRPIFLTTMAAAVGVTAHDSFRIESLEPAGQRYRHWTDLFHVFYAAGGARCCS